MAKEKADLTLEDAHGELFTLGSIVEIARWSSDRYKGLWWVVGFDVSKERGVRVLLSQEKRGKWDLMVTPNRLIMRSFSPQVYKGE